MNQNIIQKVIHPQIEIKHFDTIHLLGDPGCDGLGAEIMSIFGRSLKAPGASFKLVLGDLVPTGTEKLYESVTKFISQTSPLPVYTLCGNHDTEHYEQYFGLRNYALYNHKVLFLVLDNSSRNFSEATLTFAANELRKHKEKHIVIFFHIPPPNDKWSNHMSLGAWQPFSTVVASSGAKISYYICGHVHNYFEDRVDGIPLIVSGGAGARLEPIGNAEKKEFSQHHIVALDFDEKHGITHRFIPLTEICADCNIDDISLRDNLNIAFGGEAKAHFMYRYYAEQLSAKGEEKLAHLFRALSDAEYYHAKNHFSLLEKALGTKELAENALDGEQYEVKEMYPFFLNTAIESGDGLSYYAMLDALEAEKIHSQLLIDYLKNGRVPETFSTCTSCGQTFANQKVQRCPICGAPADKIKVVL